MAAQRKVSLREDHKRTAIPGPPRPRDTAMRVHAPLTNSACWRQQGQQGQHEGWQAVGNQEVESCLVLKSVCLCVVAAGSHAWPELDVRTMREGEPLLSLWERHVRQS